MVKKLLLALSVLFLAGVLDGTTTAQRGRGGGGRVGNVSRLEVRPGNMSRPARMTRPATGRRGLAGNRPGLGGGNRPTTLPGGHRPGLGGGDRPTPMPSVAIRRVVAALSCRFVTFVN
jgi:hypothetical protein